MIELPGYAQYPTGFCPHIDRQAPRRQLLYAMKILQWYAYQPEHRGENEWRGLCTFLHRGGGDCEDWALAFRSILIGMGWHPDDLAIVQGNTSRGAHAVLVARIGDDLYALDQRTMDVRSWDQLYDFTPFALTCGDKTAALLEEK